jgi:hypothetical protein
LLVLGGDASPPGAVVRGQRGKVVGYSPESRRRFMRSMDAIDEGQAGLPVFLTLTYPGEFSGSWEVWKRDLRQWLKRLGRQYPQAWGCWRLEPQKRGAPHFHLLVWGTRIDKEWLSRSWFEVVGSGDERHRRAGTQVQAVRSWNGVKHYTAKYIAKVGELPAEWGAGVGRWWGWFNRQAMPSTPVDVPLGPKQRFAARRVVWALMKKRGLMPRKWNGRLGVARGVAWSFNNPRDSERLVDWARSLDPGWDWSSIESAGRWESGEFVAQSFLGQRHAQPAPPARAAEPARITGEGGLFRSGLIEIAQARRGLEPPEVLRMVRRRSEGAVRLLVGGWGHRPQYRQQMGERSELP